MAKIDKLLGDLQFWLQGYPNKDRSRIAIQLGNGLSTLRFWWYRLTHEEES